MDPDRVFIWVMAMIAAMFLIVVGPMLIVGAIERM